MVPDIGIIFMDIAADGRSVMNISNCSEPRKKIHGTFHESKCMYYNLFHNVKVFVM